MKKGLCFFVWAIFLMLPIDGHGEGFEASSVLALVNGEVITAGHLLEEVAPLRRSSSNAAVLNTADRNLFEVLDQLIEDRLMIQEARRIGLDNSEGFLEKVNTLVKRESVRKLREDEIQKKASVSDAEIIALLQKRHGGSLYSGTDIPDNLRTRIKEELRRKKEKKLSERFLARIRKKADIWIDYSVMDVIDPQTPYEGEEDTVARVNGQPIPVDAFIRHLKEAFDTMRISTSHRKRGRKKESEVNQALKDKILDRLITFALIEQEALRRDYLMDTTFANKIEREKEKLLVRTFKEQRIYSQALPTQRDLKRYYHAHPREFREGYEVWKRELRFQSREAAEAALAELKQGASFEAMAMEDVDDTDERAEVWIKIDRFPKPVGEVLEDLEIGETSGVIAHGKQFKIITLLGKRGGKLIPYTKALDQIKRTVSEEKFQEALSTALSRYRAKADIKIRRDILKAIEKTYSQPEEGFKAQGLEE